MLQLDGLTERQSFSKFGEFLLGKASGNDGTTYLMMHNEIFGYEPQWPFGRFRKGEERVVHAIGPNGEVRWHAFLDRSANGRLKTTPQGNLLVFYNYGQVSMLSSGGDNLGSLDTKMEILFQPAFLHGNVMVTAGFSQLGRIQAFDLERGRLWEYPIQSAVANSPVVATDNSVRFCSASGYLYCLESDGSLRWRTELGNGIYRDMALAVNGTCYVPLDDTLFAVSADGELAWSRELGGGQIAEPAVDSAGNVYCASPNAGILCLAGDGSELWCVDPDGETEGWQLALIRPHELFVIHGGSAILVSN